MHSSLAKRIARTTSPFACASVLGLALGATAATGCSSAAGELTPGAQTTTASPDGEGARVQAYLDSLYTLSDVRHTFVSAMGDRVDCVDFAAAPGVRQLLAAGETMESILAPIEKARAAHAAPKTNERHPAYFEGDLDANGAARSCPEGTYAHLHITPETIAARGGLDAYLKPHRAPESPDAVHPASAVPADGGYEGDIGYYAWVMNDFSPTNSLSSIQGGISTMTIAAPTLSKYSGDHSVAQVWLTGNDADFANRQTLEAGWEATSLGTAGPRPAQLFIATTPNGYKTWCEDSSANSGCPAWVPNPDATLMLGGTLPASTVGGTQHELTVDIEHPFTTSISCIIRRGCNLQRIYSGWDFTVTIDGGTPVYLGYFANSGYGGIGLSVGGNDFQVGGEIYDTGKVFGPPPEVTMGEGVLSKGVASYGSSAYHHDFGYWDSTSTFQTGGSIIHNTNPAYVFNTTAAPGKAAWVNYFYYGDYAP